MERNSNEGKETFIIRVVVTEQQPDIMRLAAQPAAHQRKVKMKKMKRRENMDSIRVVVFCRGSPRGYPTCSPALSGFALLFNTWVAGGVLTLREFMFCAEAVGYHYG